MSSRPQRSSATAAAEKMAALKDTKYDFGSDGDSDAGRRTRRPRRLGV
jgi:hypothetical protein